MIKIDDKSKCCGCSACIQKCPRQCISMQLDEEGFYYPVTDDLICIDCGLCEKVCPVINRSKERTPIKCYAAKGRNIEIVRQSSSAGIFTLLAEKVIKDGGVVFGARFDSHWEVEHAYTETIEGIAQFRSSKYVQSSIGKTYIEAKEFLDQGKTVLYTGTPCQLAGLHHFLRKDYENLIAVDIVCHGVPSPGIWRDYLRYLMPEGNRHQCSEQKYLQLSDGLSQRIKKISFRDKQKGWKKYSFVLHAPRDNNGKESTNSKPIIHEKHYENLYLKTYLHGVMSRQSCYSCTARKGRSGSDILLGDFWGVNSKYPEFYSSDGVSMALAYTEKGKKLIEDLNLEIINIPYDDTKGNRNIEFDEAMPQERMPFFANYRVHGINELVRYCKSKQQSPLKILYRNIIDNIKLRLK